MWCFDLRLSLSPMQPLWKVATCPNANASPCSVKEKKYSFQIEISFIKCIYFELWSFSVILLLHIMDPLSIHFFNLTIEISWKTNIYIYTHTKTVKIFSKDCSKGDSLVMEKWLFRLKVQNFWFTSSMLFPFKLPVNTIELFT